MDFEIIGEVTEVVTIASGTAVPDRARLKKLMDLADGESARESRVFDSRIAEYEWQRLTGTKLMESEKRNSN